MGWSLSRQLFGSGYNQRNTDEALNRVQRSSGAYDGLTRQGAATLADTTPMYTSSLREYLDYLDRPMGSDARDAGILDSQTRGINLDAERAAARLARDMGGDSLASGATGGALALLEDRRLAAQADARTQITQENLRRQEEARRARVQLLAEELARGRADFLTGVQGGQGIDAAVLELMMGRENTANRNQANWMGAVSGLVQQGARALGGG